MGGQASACGPISIGPLWVLVRRAGLKPGCRLKPAPPMGTHHAVKALAGSSLPAPGVKCAIPENGLAPAAGWGGAALGSTQPFSQRHRAVLRNGERSEAGPHHSD